MGWPRTDEIKERMAEANARVRVDEIVRMIERAGVHCVVAAAELHGRAPTGTDEAQLRQLGADAKILAARIRRNGVAS